MSLSGAAPRDGKCPSLQPGAFPQPVRAGNVSSVPGHCQGSADTALERWEKHPRTSGNELNLIQRLHSLVFMESVNSHTGFAQLLWLHRLLLGFQLLVLILSVALGGLKG